MTGRSRVLLCLLLALLVTFAQQAGYRHLLGHAGDTTGLRSAGERFTKTTDAPADSGERIRVCPDCLTLLSLGGLAGVITTAPVAEPAAEIARSAPYRSITRPVPTPKAQGPPQRS